MGDEPLSVVALARYCEEYGDQILVRARRDGEWKSVLFCELDADEQSRYIEQWARHGIVPVRLPD